MASFPLFKWLVRGLAAAFGLTLVWAAVSSLQAQESAPAGALAKVPADAAGFVHIKAGAIWKSEVAAGLRDMVANVGAELLTTLNKRFNPPPSNIDTIIAYALPASEESAAATGMLLGFAAPFDQAKAAKSLVPNSLDKNHFGQKYVEDTKSNLALKVLDNRTILLANKKDMPLLLAHDAPAQGAQTSHLAAAAGKAVYAHAEMKSLPPIVLDNMPAGFKPLTAAKSAVFTCDVGKDVAMKLNLKFGEGTEAVAAEKSVRDGLQTFRDQISETMKESEKKLTDAKNNGGIAEWPDTMHQLVAIGAAKALDNYLAHVPLKQAGDSLTWEGRFDPNHPQTMAMAAALSAGVVMPATQNVRAAAVAAEGQANLKQLATAMQAYHDTNKMFPSAVFSKDGKKPLLSWRVAILPFLKENDLYKQFKLDEPWDSDNNKKLLAKMPTVFNDADAPKHKDEGMTHYQVFVGNGAGFRIDTKGTKIFDIVDGASSTIMIATATEPVPWTKPADMSFAPGKPLPKLGLGGKKFNAVMFDGSVRSFPTTIAAHNLRALITIGGGELIGDDF